MLLLRQEIPHLVLQTLFCQPQVFPDLIKRIRSQHAVYASRGKLRIIALAEIHLKVHKVFLISKSGVRKSSFSFSVFYYCTLFTEHCPRCPQFAFWELVLALMLKQDMISFDL